MHFCFMGTNESQFTPRPCPVRANCRPGQFSAVARLSGATPSAVSRSVSRLEHELGCKLLHRSTRKLRLSDAGKTVYAHAQEMLESARLAMDSASSTQEVAQGKLTSACQKPSGVL
ncbi:D-malate degradation protein R [Raoultella planticola]|uniref:D-malate degradation protein R n=1 Tax=Raoultella planticola TaxID=575 RepID=A0A485B457_RAOPL|nr:D-malate degradation protein R [Raoultella planticola]